MTFDADMSQAAMPKKARSGAIREMESAVQVELSNDRWGHDGWHLPARQAHQLPPRHGHKAAERSRNAFVVRKRS